MSLGEIMGYFEEARSIWAVAAGAAALLIYVLSAASLNKKMDVNFKKMNVKFDELSQKMDVSAAALNNKMDAKFDEVNTSLTATNAAVAANTTSLNKLGEMLGTTNAAVTATNAAVAANTAAINNLHAGLARVEGTTSTLLSLALKQYTPTRCGSAAGEAGRAGSRGCVRRPCSAHGCVRAASCPTVPLCRT